jgi:hypothetical protein
MGEMENLIRQTGEMSAAQLRAHYPRGQYEAASKALGLLVFRGVVQIRRDTEAQVGRDGSLHYHERWVYSCTH